MPVKKIEKRDEAFNGAIGRFLGAKNTGICELAKRVGVERQTLTSWRRNPSAATLGKLRVLIHATQMSDEEVLEIMKYGAGYFEQMRKAAAK